MSEQEKPSTIFDVMMQATRMNIELMGEMTQRMTSMGAGMTDSPSNSVMYDVVQNYQKFWMSESAHPGHILDKQIDLWQQQMGLWNRTLMAMGGKELTPVVETPKGDRRFKDEDWEKNPIFNYLRESYLINCKAVLDTIDEAEGIDDNRRQRIRFFTRQMLNAASPSNFALTNPEVLKLMQETGGKNIVRGMKNLMRDMKQSANALNIRMTDPKAFQLGVNVATTPGKVVFKNQMFELIQYTPTTEKVSKVPLLMVPPWINKFYIMDLRESNSLVKWAVDNGHTVFMMSWVNPDASYADVSIDQYLEDGLLVAMDKVEAITGEKAMNAMGYCAGGILLSIALAWLANKGQENRIKSATTFATLYDFSDPGDIGAFVDEPIVNALEKHLDRVGYTDGRMMAVAFALLRENDLYWNYYVQNYLKGEDPKAFDLLYWNSDCTNVTAATHIFFLRKLYMENLLMKAGGIIVAGEPIDLTKIKTPVFMVATLQDHIAKWKTCYTGTQLLNDKSKFVLAESGHIAGIINPPGGKYGYYLNDKYEDDPQEWFEKAEYNEGSWWPLWQEWAKTYKGAQVAARQPGTHKDFPAIYDAPGQYVKKRVVEEEPELVESEIQPA